MSEWLPPPNNVSSANGVGASHSSSLPNGGNNLSFSNSSTGDSISYNSAIQTLGGGQEAGFSARRGSTGEVASQTTGGDGVVQENGATVDLTSSGEVLVNDPSKGMNNVDLGNAKSDPSVLQSLTSNGILDQQGVQDLQGVQANGLNSLDFVQRNFSMSDRDQITQAGSQQTGDVTSLSDIAGITKNDTP